jgi:outer membrane protein
MYKLFSKKFVLFWLYILTCPAIFILTGCVHFNSNEKDYNIFDADIGSVRQIEPIVLEEAREETAEYNPVEPELPEIEVSLEQCRALTLENNLDLTVQLIEPTIAAELVSQEEARFEATFSGLAIYSKIDSPVSSILDITGNKMDNFYTDLGVNFPLRTGGEIKVDLVDSRVKTNSFYSTFNPSYETDITASISQPLLRNAGNRVNTYAIRVMEYNRQITDTRTKMAAIRIIADVDRAYWRLYAARRLLDVRRGQYELSHALFEQTERLVDIGMKSMIELIRTKAGMADKLESIIRAENDVRDVERDLKRMLNKPGLGTETKTVLIPTTKPDPVRYKLDGERMVANALENRMEMLEIEIQLASDADRIEYQKNQVLPLVSMEYRYNINGLGTARSDSYDLLFDHDFNDQRFSLQLSVPLGNKSAKSKLRQAIYEKAKRLATRDSKREQIKYEVLNQIDKLEANWQRILASRQTTILYDEQYKAEKRRYELGLATSTDVLETQTYLADAQRTEILALAEYQIAIVDLAYATGTLLGAAKVQLEPVVPQE